MNKKILNFKRVSASLLASLAIVFSLAATASAGTYVQDAQCNGDNTTCVCPNGSAGCGSDPAASSGDLDCNNDGKPDAGCTLTKKYLNPMIKVLSGLVGVAVVAGIIIAGIQYASAAGDPQKVATAKQHIKNAILAFILFLFLYALLHFMAPAMF